MPVSANDRVGLATWGYVGLATTSTGNDDVALEVNNAANGNLIHGASCDGRGAARRRISLI